MKIQEEIHLALKEIDNKIKANIDVNSKSESILLLASLLEEEQVYEE